MRILILSSRSEKHSANLGYNVISALRESGHEVDFNFAGANTVLEKLQNVGNSWFAQQVQRVIDKYTSVRGLPMWKLRGYYEGAGYKFFVGDETKNVYSPKKLLKRLNGKKYDLIITMFFPDFLNMNSVEALCKSQNTPLLFFSIDDYPKTGGCYFCWNCQNYKIDCKYCPAFGGKEFSLAYKNAIHKKRIFSSYNIWIMVNSWMKRTFEQSSIINPNQLLLHSFIIDEDYYKPRNIELCREKLGIPSNKMTILSMRYQSMDRKGCSLAIEALNRLSSKMDSVDRAKLLLITFGDSFEGDVDFDVLDMGFVPTDTLLDIYCASTAFLSPSIGDAGPSTVNQSICCGTPVVAFEIGTAIDVIENGISGYRAAFKDVDDYAHGIESIITLNEQVYIKLRETTREMGLKKNSKKAFVQFIEKKFNKTNR